MTSELIDTVRRELTRPAPVMATALAASLATAFDDPAEIFPSLKYARESRTITSGLTRRSAVGPIEDDGSPSPTVSTRGLSAGGYNSSSLLASTKANADSGCSLRGGRYVSRLGITTTRKRSFAVKTPRLARTRMR